MDKTQALTRYLSAHISAVMIPARVVPLFGSPGELDSIIVPHDIPRLTILSEGARSKAVTRVVQRAVDAKEQIEAAIPLLRVRIMLTTPFEFKDAVHYFRSTHPPQRPCLGLTHTGRARQQRGLSSPNVSIPPFINASVFIMFLGTRNKKKITNEGKNVPRGQSRKNPGPVEGPTGSKHMFEHHPHISMHKS
jgi:hypothetical protein